MCLKKKPGGDSSFKGEEADGGGNRDLGDGNHRGSSLAEPELCVKRGSLEMF